MRMRRIHVVAVFILLAAIATSAANPPAIPSPSEFLKINVGEDRQLADYRQIVAYLKALDAASGRLELEVLGKTTLGEDMVMAVISSEENIKNKKRYMEIARRLADPRGLTPQQSEALVKEGRAIVLVTCNIHSTEIGSSQMAMEWAHALVTGNDPVTKHRLDNVILLLVPSLNPDGQIMETEWYRKWVGTKYEGGRMPWLYHHYVGHDDNRDWYMLTQKETQNVSDAVYQRWFPQFWVDEHQMGSTGPRIFIPPYADPVAKTINPLIFRGLNMVGTNMAFRLEEAKKSGAIYGYSFDAYWPGGTRNTAWWKNIFGLLIEVASARLATPVTVAPTELSGGGKGLVEYRQQINFPNPWPGGTWRLRDIMDYERIISDALIEIAADRREDYLRGVVTLANDAIAHGKPGEYWRISTEQRDPIAAARLAHLMRRHGAEVLVSQDKKNFYLPTAQPYNRFIEEMFSVQRYPEIKLQPGPNILAPYDVAAWSLPLMMNVEVQKQTLAAAEQKGLRPAGDDDWPQGGVSGNGNVIAVAHTSNNATRLINALTKKGNSVSIATEAFSVAGTDFAPGTLLVQGNDVAAELKRLHLAGQALPATPPVKTAKLREARVALYKPFAASMDEGWTRWLLEQYEFNLKNIDNKAVKAGQLNAAYDVVVLPDVTRDIIMDGRPRAEDGQGRGGRFEELPPDYVGGIGRDGARNLKEFVMNGGTLVAMASSTEFAAEELELPARNALRGVRQEDFYCPGSILRMYVDPTHPVAYGLPNEIGGFVEEGLAFQTSLTGPEMSKSVLAWYPDDEKDVLISGWIRGAERLEHRSSVVAFNVGKGKVVLIGFRPQHRAQTEGTFKLLFNAIHWGAME